MRILRAISTALLIEAGLAGVVFAQTTYTWQQLKNKFEASNPTLRAGQDNIAESKAMEVTAYLRPNPELTFSTDGTQLGP